MKRQLGKEEDEEENEVYYVGEGTEDEGVKRKRKLEEMLRRLQEACGVNSKTGLGRIRTEEEKENIKRKENLILKIKVALDKEKLKEVKQVHEHSGHRLGEKMMQILRGSRVGKKEYIDEVIKRCKVCQRKQPGKHKPKVSVVKPKGNNDVLTVDLKINVKNNLNVLWMIDPFNRFAKGLVVKTKTAEEVVEGIKYNWFYQFGAPQTGIWSDNGTEFANVKMQELCKIWKISFAAGAPYSPWSNGLNERNHGSCDRVLEKILIEDPKIDLQKAVTRYIHK